MTPKIVLRDGAPVFALGGSGGMRIPTATTQVLLARLAFDRTPAEAVADPRIETPPTGGLLLDSNAPLPVRDDLVQRGEIVDRTKPNFSAVQAIAIDSQGGGRVLEGGSDPRKGGVVLVE
jgi:gamma-glutamyltranspeptidase / glutathione hydrolase